MHTIKAYEYEPTEEEQERARLARLAISQEQKQFKEEMQTIFNNIYCPVCGHRFMSGVVCRKAGGSVCMSHCKSCRYFSADFWHCLYLGTAHNN